MQEFIDRTSTSSGTPLNRKTMMAVQGFEAKTTRFNADGSIVEVNEAGQTKTTYFIGDSVIREVFEGEKAVTKTTTFNDDGSISEVIS